MTPAARGPCHRSWPYPRTSRPWPRAPSSVGFAHRSPPFLAHLFRVALNRRHLQRAALLNMVARFIPAIKLHRLVASMDESQASFHRWFATCASFGLSGKLFPDPSQSQSRLCFQPFLAPLPSVTECLQLLSWAVLRLALRVDRSRQMSHPGMQTSTSLSSDATCGVVLRDDSVSMLFT